ncbi:replication initiation protein [Noviherbaspirillum sp.]|uniref:replication initiation protein n=1 Tax=Noviherbaspirillum sp. TaxID=1926288 RepID=UPI002FE404B2
MPTIPGVDESSDGRDALVEFRKANDSIGLRVVEGQFSLLSRKLYNVFISTAQKQQRPGVNAPIDEPSAESYFWIALQDVVKDTKYNSNDYETLKEHANELQNIRVEAESTKMWTSERLLSGVKIYNSKGLKSKGGTVWLGFSFPPEVMHMVLKPTIYTKFSLWYQTQLRTASSLALYEVCRRYASSPSHLTNRDKWERWYYTITGTVTTDVNLPEYKYFKRDHLMKSVTEINAITDIEIELLEFKEGRKVADIQFKVYQKAQSSFELPAIPIINMEMIERIMALGISKDEATAIYTSYDEQVVLAHLHLVESRQKNTRAGPLESAAAYFKTAIKKGYANGKVIEVNEAKPVKPKSRKNLRERFMIARAKDALTHYDQLVSAEQKKLLATFAKKADKSIKPYLKKGLEMTLVRNAFGDWLATELWGEPTDAQIIDFLESEGDD